MLHHKCNTVNTFKRMESLKRVSYCNSGATIPAETATGACCVTHAHALQISAFPCNIPGRHSLILEGHSVMGQVIKLTFQGCLIAYGSPWTHDSYFAGTGPKRPMGKRKGEGWKIRDRILHAPWLSRSTPSSFLPTPCFSAPCLPLSTHALLSCLTAFSTAWLEHKLHYRNWRIELGHKSCKHYGHNWEIAVGKQIYSIIPMATITWGGAVAHLQHIPTNVHTFLSHHPH